MLVKAGQSLTLARRSLTRSVLAAAAALAPAKPASAACRAACAAANASLSPTWLSERCAAVAAARRRRTASALAAVRPARHCSSSAWGKEMDVEGWLLKEALFNQTALYGATVLEAN
jgi:hypothetical protein